MSGNSLISQILTEAEITELGLHGSVTKHCSSPYIINKKHFIKICVYYLLSTFLFFFVYVTITVLVLTSSKTELNNTIILVIYVYIFLFFYIDLIVSNTIKYDLVKRYNIKEVRQRIYGRFLGPSSPGGGRAPVSKEVGHGDALRKEHGQSDPSKKEHGNSESPQGATRKKAKGSPRPDRTSRAKGKKKKKMFTSEKYYLVEEQEDDEHEQRHEQRHEQHDQQEANQVEEGRRRTASERVPPPPADEEKFYHLDQLKNVNETINAELMKYIQYENNNYTVDSYRYDLFLIISGFINQLNIFFDLLFLFYVYDYSKKLFSVCLFIYAYYLIHFGILIRFSIVMLRALFSIHRKSLSRSYRRATYWWRWLVTFFCTRLLKSLKRLVRAMITMRASNQLVNPRQPKIFFNKYVNYNSWSFAYHQGVSFKRSKGMLKFLRDSDSEDTKEVMLLAGTPPPNHVNIHIGHIGRGRDKTSKRKYKDRLPHTNPQMQYAHAVEVAAGGVAAAAVAAVAVPEDREGKRKNYFEKALRPSHVQTIADMSSFLSHYHILNIIKSKFLSAHSIYEHVRFTLVFFVWKLLYMDVVLCLLKIFILFYTSDLLTNALFIVTALVNIANSYVIHLVDNNLMSDIGST
ncbi:hypothetical protein AK88_01612 [Plasmodium fragile]|uniref:Uncharacterized protein n=1 Tax=Plasmodium fragile TaxID=5857 RepID=A0A0D9QSW5_PLAFR|nr:uncharacterized protein AK88_01612 [Plasmodium fragile]KJP88731.1 hypothetical protein AK88_01612 [Plasmodium fragile]